MQQKLGFQDKELSTPKHDEIMLWLDSWIETELPSIIKWEKIEIDDLESVLPDSLGLVLPNIPPIKLGKKIWEQPIVDKTYTIGFADMMIEYVYPHLRLGSDKKSFQIEINTYDSRLAFFEVKPSIPSLGELIRQIRMYQTYT